MRTIARHWRAVLARLPLPMLALAASYGVYSFNALFVPVWVALVSAAAFELTYVALAAVQTPDRRRAAAIAVAAVVVSILYNTLAGLFHIRPALLTGRPLWADVVLAVLHGLPLAVVAYNVAALLLHAESAQRPRIAAQRRALVRRLVHTLRTTRGELAQAGAAAAQLEQQARAAAAGEGAELRSARAALEEARAATAAAEARAARALRELEQQRAAATRWQAEAAQLAEAAAQAGELDVRAVAQWAAGLGAGSREIARQLRRPEATVRGWLKAPAQVSAAD